MFKIPSASDQSTKKGFHFIKLSMQPLEKKQKTEENDEELSRLGPDEPVSDPLLPGESTHPTEEEKEWMRKCDVVGDQLRKATVASWDLQEEIGKKGSIKLIRKIMSSSVLWHGSQQLSGELARHGHLQCLEIMIHRDKLDSPRASEGAAQAGQTAVLKLLQDYKQKHSWLTFDYACSARNLETINYLLEIGFRPNALHLGQAKRDEDQTLYHLLQPYQGQQTDPTLFDLPVVRRM